MTWQTDDPAPDASAPPDAASGAPPRSTRAAAAALTSVPALPPDAATDAPVVAERFEGLVAELLWSLVDSAPDGIVLVDESGRIVFGNRQAEAMFGYEHGALAGWPVEALLPPRSRAVHCAHRTRYRAEPRPRAMAADLALHARRADGSEFPVEISLSPVRTDDGVQTIAAVRDVTERRATEARWREIHEILDATRDGLAIFDAETLRYTYVNQGLVDQVGYPAQELLEMTKLHIAPELTDTTFRELLSSFERGEVTERSFRTVHRRRDGRDVPVEVLMQAIPGADGRPAAYVSIARDISERLEAESRELRAAQDLRVLEDRERTARDLHDLVIQRLFAAGMALQSSLAISATDRRTERVEHVIDELDETIREIRTAIFGLTAPIVRDDGGLRRRILDTIEHERPALGFAPHVSFEGLVDGTDDDVAHHLVAVLRELLSNVARHAGATRVDIWVVAGDDEILLRVSDDGVGLDAGVHGRGHGLVNMGDRARGLGGTFSLTSGPGGGTVGECRFPRPAA